MGGKDVLELYSQNFGGFEVHDLVVAEDLHSEGEW